MEKSINTIIDFIVDYYKTDEAEFIMTTWLIIFGIPLLYLIIYIIIGESNIHPIKYIKKHTKRLLNFTLGEDKY